ncbi:MAG: hypothetical protein WKG07_25845 [Hymenobacter sp.]
MVAGTGSTNQYAVDADKPMLRGWRRGRAAAPRPPPPAQANVYGSDYMIKEVLAFDYAVGEGRSPDDTAGQWQDAPLQHLRPRVRRLCRHRPARRGRCPEERHQNPHLRRPDYQVGSRRGGLRDPHQPGARRRRRERLVPRLHASPPSRASDYPQPTSATGRRIVVAYASNPAHQRQRHGRPAGTAGNHTPQDIWVGRRG